MFGDGYFGEEVEADGPWEARFLFCGKYGVSPDRVTVFQSTFGKYWCRVGQPRPSAFLKFANALIESLG